MLAAYFSSASTTNLVRALGSGGFSDLSRVHEWGMDWASSTEKGRAYLETADRCVVPNFHSHAGLVCFPKRRS
jgi:3-deoxy-D-arabino-heptulosonate 7-phosphate (DAHP) synthase class II